LVLPLPLAAIAAALLLLPTAFCHQIFADDVAAVHLAMNSWH